MPQFRKYIWPFILTVVIGLCASAVTYWVFFHD